MRIVSVATHHERMFDLFVQSTKRHNIPLDLLGVGETWQGFGWRWSLIQTHLENIPDEELILITDAFDTLILKNAKAFETAFKSFGVPLVFSTEPHANMFNPMARYYRWRIFGEDPIINGGTYIGTCGAIRSFIRQLKYTHGTDDQRFLTALSKMIHMTVDQDFKLIYHCVSGCQEDIIPDACVVTFPGGGHTTEILSNLGYQYTSKETYFNTCLLSARRARHYTPFFWREMICFACALLLGGYMWIMKTYYL